MKHKFKALSLALVAVFAMSALVASAAHAAEFTWASGTTKLTATEESHQTFVTTPGTVTCNSVHGHAAVSGTGATSVTTTAITYNNSGSADTCPGPFGTTPKIEMNGCQYQFTAGTLLKAGESTGTAHIECPGSAKIKINAAGCTIEVGTQNNLEGHVIYRTIAGTPTDVTGEVTLSGIDYNHFGILCGTASRTNGTYTGNITITGFNSSGVQTAVSVS